MEPLIDIIQYLWYYKVIDEFIDTYHSLTLNNEIWGCGLSITLEQEAITYPGIKKENEGWTESVPVRWSTKLLALSKAVKRISKIADFPDYAITAHILTGMKPFLPRYSIQTYSNYSEVSSDNWYKSMQVIIKINATDVSFVDLQNIYKEYRHRLTLTRKKSIQEKQLEIIKLVRDAGGAPQKGIKNFSEICRSNGTINSPQMTTEVSKFLCELLRGTAF